MALPKAPNHPSLVLVVEDDDDLRESMCDVLRGCGFAVEGANNGASALALLREQRPDAILLDLSMPVMTGRELLSAIHKDPAFASMSVLLVTGDHEPPDGYVVLRKPPDLGVLLRHLTQILW